MKELIKQKSIKYLKKTFTVECLKDIIESNLLYNGICVALLNTDYIGSKVSFYKIRNDTNLLINTFCTRKRKLADKYHWAYGNVKSRKLFLIKVLKELHGYEYKQ